MVDDAELANLDPFDLVDAEAARLDVHLSALPDEGWSRPSRCEGWSVRDVLAHVAGVEDYHRACLDGVVQAFIGDFGARGANDLDSANALSIADRADLTSPEVLAAWRDASAENRCRFRERGDGVIDTFVGDYPSRWQAFHVASELATHADDVFVPVSPEERDERLGWRARFSRFALAEGKPVPQEAIESMAKPITPTWMYALLGGLGWKRRAKKHGAQKKLRDRPYHQS